MTRLEVIMSLVDTPYIIDVGSDHGFVPKMLLEDGIIKHAFVNDISEKCLNKAMSNLSTRKSDCTFLLGDGLSVLSQIDSLYYKDTSAIITGMGGEEIIKILSNKPAELSCYILGAQTSIFELKEYLAANNYNIVRDIIAFDGEKFYNILKVVHGQMVTDDMSLYFGEENIKNRSEVFLSYCRYLLAKYDNIIKFRHDDRIIKLHTLIKQILGE